MRTLNYLKQSGYSISMGIRTVFFILPLVVFAAHAQPATDSGATAIIRWTLPADSIASGTWAVHNRRVTGSTEKIFEQLDSLGYFGRTTNQLSRDSLEIFPQHRFSIRAEQCIGYRIPLDSLKSPVTDNFYDAQRVSRTSQAICAYLGDRGYPFAKTTLEIADSDSSDSIDILYITAPGPYATVVRPVFACSTKTAQSLLTKDITNHPGFPFDRRTIDRSIARLRSRKYITDASCGSPLLTRCSAADSGATGHQKQDTVCIVLPFCVSDRSGLGLDGALAWQSSASGGLSGMMNISLLNIFGQGEEASLNYKGESRLQQLSMSAEKPYLLGLPVMVSGNFDLEVAQNLYGKLAGELRILTELSPWLRTGIGISGHGTTVSIDSTTVQSWNVYGISYILQRLHEPMGARRYSYGFLFESGTNSVTTLNQQILRLTVSFSAGTHIPIGNRFGVRLRLSGRNLFSAEDSLPAIELFRIGGFNSLRGYVDNQFAFRVCAYGQIDFLYYLTDQIALSTFCDIGGGLVTREQVQHPSAASAQILTGYGLGLRIPVRIGILNLEYGRNSDDGLRTAGRIHMKLEKSFSTDWAW